MMPNKLTNEVIEKKKEELIHFLVRHFDVTKMSGRNNKYHSYDIVSNDFLEEYKQTNYFYQIGARRFKKTVAWIDNPSAWIRIISVDEEKRGKGFAMHIKCRVDDWTGGRSKVDKRYFEKWKLPLDKNNIHLRIAHGNELIYSVLHEEVEKFDPSVGYFEDFLNHTFDLYSKNMLDIKGNIKGSVEETDVSEKNNELKPSYTKKNGYGNQKLEGKKVYLNNKVQDDELEFQERIQSLPNPPKGMKIDFVAKEKRSKLTNRICRIESRDANVAKNAVAAASYLCGIDKDHPYFKSKKSKENYVEAHHLIPIHAIDKFEKSIDIEANVVSLCPNCHRKLHHAQFSEVKPLLEKLYEERKSDLKKCHIILSLEELLAYYK